MPPRTSVTLVVLCKNARVGTFVKAFPVLTDARHQMKLTLAVKAVVTENSAGDAPPGAAAP
jgi:hypothetical protein